MIKLHTADGKTTRLDLNDGEQAKMLVNLLKRNDFQKSVTGVSVVQDAVARVRCECGCGEFQCNRCGTVGPVRTRAGVQYSLARPETNESVFYQVEGVDLENGHGGERVTCFAGEARIVMMVHRGQPSVRIGLSNPGKLCFSPNKG